MRNSIYFHLPLAFFFSVIYSKASKKRKRLGRKEFKYRVKLRGGETNEWKKEIVKLHV